MRSAARKRLRDAVGSVIEQPRRIQNALFHLGDSRFVLLSTYDTAAEDTPATLATSSLLALCDVVFNFCDIITSPTNFFCPPCLPYNSPVQPIDCKINAPN